VLAGVPAGAWTGGNAYGWTTPDNRSAQQWGDIVRNADPGFNGARPRLQLWHGTADTTLNYMPNFAAEVAQWTNVFGVSDANATKSSFKASADTWARTSYKNGSGTVVLETNVADGAPHDLSGRGLWGDVVRFFGLDQDTTGGGTGSGGSGAGGASSGGSANGGSGGASAGGKTGNTGGNGTAGSGKGGTNSAGSPSGGASAAGQSSSAGTGNASGGSSNASGGSSNASGGASAGGSMNSSGGASSGGSNNGLGGSAPGLGGQSASAGTSSGGATTGTGGASMSGGGSDNGCSCTLPGGAQRPLSGVAALAALGLATLLRRRKKTR
jgi:MYXO-CTERM domain-containing protein